MLDNSDFSKKDISLFKGKWGALFFLFYYEKFCDQTKNKATDYLELLYSNLDTQTINLTYCNGLSGPYWLLNHLNKYDFLDINIAEIIPDFITTAIEQSENCLHKSDFDFLHGSAGIINLLTEYTEYPEVKRHLSIFVDSLTKFAIRTSRGASLPIFVPYNKEKLTDGMDAFSLAHGNCAILILLIKIHKAEIATQKCAALIEDIIDFILSNENKFVQIPKSMYPAHVDNINFHSRVSWCYGDLNVAVALWQCGQHLNNDSWKKKALDILKYNTNRNSCTTSGVKDICLCHGTAGNAAIYMRMWQETKEPVLLDCAKEWFKLTHEMYQFSKTSDVHGVLAWQGVTAEWQYRWDLLDGSAGTGLALISEYTGTALPWDEFLLISSG